MAEEAIQNAPVPAVEGTPAPRTGHRPVDPREALAELTAKAHQIRQEAGGAVAVAMKDVIAAATGMAGFAIESARDLVQFLVRRGQMSQEEADRIVREAEAAHAARPATERERPTASKMAADKHARVKADAAAAAASLRATAAPAKVATPAPKPAAAPAKQPAAAKAAPKAAAPKPAVKAAGAKKPTAGARSAAKSPARATRPAAKSSKTTKPSKAAAKPATKHGKNNHSAAKAPARKAAAPAKAGKKTARKR